MIQMFVSLFLSIAGATTIVEPLGIAELSKRAERVVMGEVVATRSEMTRQGIYTVATIVVDEMLRGRSEPVLEVRVPGGRIDDIELTVVGAPRMIHGYQFLLFLDGQRVVGLGQGAFVVEDGVAWRNLAEYHFASPSADQSEHATARPPVHYMAVDMKEIRSIVR